MATSKTTSAPALSLLQDPDCVNLAREAAGEIESICMLLLRELQGLDVEQLALRGLALRAKALNSVVSSVLFDDSRTLEEMHEVVRGEALEVAHG